MPTTTTTAPSATTTHPATTTTHPPTTTTRPPTTTTHAPTTTTTRPPTTTTHPPTTTTHAPTTTTRPPTTTTHPPTTTTHAPTTTTHAPTTTTHAPTTTTHPATTTTHAATTTAAPASTTTHPASTTTHAGTTTTHPPGSTTTHPPGSTTTHAGTTTTAAPGATGFSDDGVTVDVSPDDGADHHPHSYQVPTNAKLKLNWKANNAKSVKIDGLDNPDQDASGSVEIPAEDKTYTLTAVAADGTESAPYTVDIHTHAPGASVSPHNEVDSGVAKILQFRALKAASKVASGGSPDDDEIVNNAHAGESITLSAIVTSAVDEVKIEGNDANLSKLGDGSQLAEAQVDLTDQMSGSFSASALKGGEEKDSQTVHVDIGAAPASTTTHPASTTTHPASTTTHPGSTTTHPASTTTHPASTTTHPGSTTTAPAATTTAPGGTTTAPGGTTTHPASTTTHPATTTSAALDDSVFQNLAWGDKDYTHGEDIGLSADAPGVPDGTTVYFLVENSEDGGAWQFLQQVQATAQGAKVSGKAVLKDTDPPTGEHHCSYRFTVSFKPSQNAPAGTTTAKP